MGNMPGTDDGKPQPWHQDLNKDTLPFGLRQTAFALGQRRIYFGLQRFADGQFTVGLTIGEQYLGATFQVGHKDTFTLGAAGIEKGLKMPRLHSTFST